MKKLLLLIVMLAFTALIVQAQDVILRTDGNEIPARVLTITPTEVAYVPAAQPPSADTLHIAATEVFLVRFANGTNQLVTAPTATTAPTVNTERTPQQMNDLGREDARKYFRAPGAFWGTAGATFVTFSAFGVGGIATGAAIAASPPKRHNMITPTRALLDDPSYLAGYQKQAQRKKLGSALGGFGAGAATVVVVAVASVLIAFGAH